MATDSLLTFSPVVRAFITDARGLGSIPPLPNVEKEFELGSPLHMAMGYSRMGLYHSPVEPAPLFIHK